MTKLEANGRGWPERIVIRVTLCSAAIAAFSACMPAAPRDFSGERAFSLAREFLDFGPRVSGTDANRKAGDWIAAEVSAAGWDSFFDEGEYMNTPVRNVVGRKGGGPILLLGAHYDSRRCADQPRGGCPEPVLGANDGASGVAVLLELARTLELDWERRQVWLVFFDAEDNGGLDGWDWIAGSRQFARRVRQDMAAGAQFTAMILVDMIGDADQQIYLERNSDPALRGEIWAAADALGFGAFFIAEEKYRMIDDHIPFRELGIPAVDIIDFDFPFWHTTEDTLDKISAASLERVGRTVEVWLEGGAPEDRSGMGVPAKRASDA
ncbi:MAG: M28 family peptidase [Anaerolineales bacterium]|nr:M28 family peptidase [Anaerolineales bacterium]